jgi:cell pole-organizing protein PopZ
VEEEADVLELTEMVATKTQDDFDKAEIAADVMFRDPEPAREIAPRMSPPAPRMDDQILSQHASSAVSSAFGALSNSMFAGDSRTVDELVREILRPMLKAWLDDNLPSLVERLVRAEIERVSRGR